MTRVDFYILEAGGAEARQRFACRLTEKAFAQGHRVFVHTGDPESARRLDELLWTFRAGSFVPHELAEGDPGTPVHVGAGEPPREQDDVLINLAPEVPLFFSRFTRVAEVVDGDEGAREAGRERYRFYRERGYTLDTHNVAPMNGK